TNNPTGTDNTHQFTPLYKIVNDGYDKPFLQLLTGNNYVSIKTSNATTDLKSFSDRLEKAINAKDPVNIATDDHYMTVCQYFANTPISKLSNYQGPPGATGPFIEIHNQWGNTGDYTIGGTNYKVHMENGYFTVPVADLSKMGLISAQMPEGPEHIDTSTVAS